MTGTETRRTATATPSMTAASAPAGAKLSSRAPTMSVNRRATPTSNTSRRLRAAPVGSSHTSPATAGRPADVMTSVSRSVHTDGRTTYGRILRRLRPYDVLRPRDAGLLHLGANHAPEADRQGQHQPDG